MKILIATDAWEPQVNGVAKTLKNTIKELKENNHNIELISPNDYKCWKLPFTKDIYSPYWITNKTIKKQIQSADYIHISTEGPIGIAVRNYCVKNKLNFTTAYHTDFPTFFLKVLRFGNTLAEKYLSWFHNKSSCVMATTIQNISTLESYGVKSTIKIWSRGVDHDLFVPIKKQESEKIRLVYCGRISPEKGILDFLKLKGEYYKKTVIGDGIDLAYYKNKYPEIKFTGFLHGKELANELAGHDIFVFPSKFDTFGLVNIEAMSCGLPVACYDVKGAGEIIAGNKMIGCADNNLDAAVNNCHQLINANNCREYILQNYTWNNATKQFIQNLVKK